MKFLLVLVALAFVACLAQDEEQVAETSSTCSKDDAKALGEAMHSCFPNKTRPNTEHTRGPRTSSEEKSGESRHRGHKRGHEDCMKRHQCNATDEKCQEFFTSLCECAEPKLEENEIFQTMKTDCNFQGCIYDETKMDCMKEKLCSCFSVFHQKDGHGKPDINKESNLYSFF